MSADLMRPRSESVPQLAACLAMMWAALPVLVAVIVTRRVEWMLLIPVGALVGAGYGKRCERRIISDIVDQWIASVHDGPYLGP